MINAKSKTALSLLLLAFVVVVFLPGRLFEDSGYIRTAEITYKVGHFIGNDESTQNLGLLYFKASKNRLASASA